MPAVRMSKEEMDALLDVPASSFRLYALLKEAAPMGACKWMSLANRVFPDGTRTRYSGAPNRYQLQMVLWRLWRENVVELLVDGRSDALVISPRSHDFRSVSIRNITNAWIARGKEIPPLRPPVPKKIRDQVFDRDGRRCIQCGAEENLTADHIHPVAKGGKTALKNLQTLCRSCNSRKGAKVPHG